MRKILPIIIIVAIIAGFSYYSVIQRRDDTPDDEEWLTERRFLEMSQSPSEQVNFIMEVKQNPQSVINTFTTLRKMIYSGDYDAPKRENLLLMQRQLFFEDLLELNPKELQILKMEAELEKWQDIEFKIIGSKSLPPDYYPVESFEGDYDIKEYVIIKVRYITNDVVTEEYQDTDIYTEYILVQNERGEWEIFGWRKTEPFVIVD